MTFSPITITLSTVKTPFVLTQSATSNISLPSGNSLTGAISLVGPSSIKGLETFIAGQYINDEILIANIAPYSYEISSANSKVVALTAATSEAILEIKKTASEVTTVVGTITFAAGTATGVINLTDAEVERGDLITIHAPSSTDATLADIAFLLAE